VAPAKAIVHVPAVGLMRRDEERNSSGSSRVTRLMQSVVLKISVEFPIVMTPDVHSRENDAEHALVKAVVALIRPVWRNACATADAVNDLRSNQCTRDLIRCDCGGCIAPARELPPPHAIPPDTPA
jgi:hypothetical protein